MLSTSGTRRLTGIYWVSGSLTCTLSKRPQRSDRGVHRTRQITAKAVHFTLQTPAGNKTPVQKDFFSIGTGGGSDLLLDGQKVEQEHACIESKSGRLYLSALVGDPDNFRDETRTWLNDSELRPGCSYLLTPGAKLAFGNQAQQYVIDFDEKSGPDPLGDMLMKGMLSQASPEVRKQMEQGL
ncbi:hypothetical protein ABBQ32_011531 [Trebouxia sp. C0010 RCD-2024]